MVDFKEFLDNVTDSGVNARQEGENAMGTELLPEGACTVRLVQIVELGLQKSSNPEWADKADRILGFEVCSKHLNTGREGVGNHKLLKMYCAVARTKGKKTLEAKLLRALDYNGDRGNMQDHLGAPFLAKIKHFTNSKGKVSEKLRLSGEEYDFSAPILVDPETGETKLLQVPDQLRENVMFVWENPMMPDELYLKTWDSLYVEGEYKDGNSRNSAQEKIMVNIEWDGSRLKRLLEERNIGDIPMTSAFE